MLRSDSVHQRATNWAGAHEANCVLVLSGLPYFLGIIGALLVYAFLQERIMLYPRGTKHFPVPTFVVLCNRAAAICFACFQMRRNGEPLQTTAPKRIYLVIAAMHIGASTSQYEMSEYLPHSEQAVAKAFKMIPVMLCSMVVTGARYTIMGWTTALTLSLGLSQMLWASVPFEPGGPTEDTEDNGPLTGLPFLLAFFLCESVALCYQEKLFIDMKTSVCDQLLYINLGTCIASLLALVLTGDLNRALLFCGGHPGFAVYVFLLCVVSVGGQWLVYTQVKAFGVAIFALTMTVRQVASLLLAFATIGDNISFVQYLGLLVVIISLLQMSRVGLRQTSTEERPLLDRSACGVSSGEA